MILLTVTIVLTLGLSFLCSILESSVLSLQPSDIAALRQKDPALGELWVRMKKNIDEPIAAILIVDTAADTIGAVIIGAQVAKLLGNAWLAPVSILFTFLTIQVGEILPKTLGVRYRRFIAAHAARPLALTLPVVRPLTWMTRRANRPFESHNPDEPHPTIEEIRALASYASLARLIDPRQEKIISKAMELDDTTVSRAMVPRTRVDALEERASVSQLFEAARRTNHSRFPLYRGEIDNIVGVVAVKDVLAAFHEGKFRAEDMPQRRLSEYMQKPLFVPETVTVADFMAEAARHNMRMVMVVDEYGGFAGIMTVADALEELVGEIAHGRKASVMVEKVAKGKWVARGLCPIEDLSVAIGVDLVSRKERYSTLSGLLMLLSGKVPRAGDVFKMQDLVFRVVEASPTLPLRVEITRKAPVTTVA